MTYNIHAGLGTDGTRDIERIARIIADSGAHVVALQEVDNGRLRSGHVDQAAVLADMTGMHVLVGTSFYDTTGGAYGNAILTNEPAELFRHDILEHMPRSEPRSAMWARLHVDGAGIDFINTHLSYRRKDRVRQAAQLLGPDWLDHPDTCARIILCGDLNCTPRSAEFRRLRARLNDAPRDAPARARATWPTRFPCRRIDHVLVSDALEATGTGVPRNTLTRKASDHLPVVADIEINPNANRI